MAVSLVCKNGCGRDCGQGPDGRVSRRASQQKMTPENTFPHVPVLRVPRFFQHVARVVFLACTLWHAIAVRFLAMLTAHVDRTCGGQKRQHGRNYFLKVFWNNAVTHIGSHDDQRCLLRSTFRHTLQNCPCFDSKAYLKKERGMCGHDIDCDIRISDDQVCRSYPKVVIAEHPMICMESDLLFFLLCDTCVVVASSKVFVWETSGTWNESEWIWHPQEWPFS